ncbi:LOW QUALITY PROTEIN: hypothetical protein OSB04_019491 [Centaurea solstitialis]|uniref:Uncharacterized protein n=1 Tax=Centaurea solstitialis TaxID=347529 RepID=A0AA38SY41_9ASTR|nr:LOW QUALITY PROTEIN: hypothetical protein OSB04_019491 [Centaurea solstitialis]
MKRDLISLWENLACLIMINQSLHLLENHEFEMKAEADRLRIPSNLRSSFPANLHSKMSSNTPAKAASSSGSFTVHSENQTNDRVVNQTLAMTSHAISFQRNRFEKFVLLKKPNNHYLVPKLNAFPTKAAILLRNHEIFHALTAHVDVPETYLTQFLLSAYVCDLVGEGLSIVGYTSDSKGKKMVSMEMNVNDLRLNLQLSERDEYDDTPTNEELIEFLHFLSYTAK